MWIKNSSVGRALKSQRSFRSHDGGDLECGIKIAQQVGRLNRTYRTARPFTVKTGIFYRILRIFPQNFHISKNEFLNQKWFSKEKYF